MILSFKPLKSNQIYSCNIIAVIDTPPFFPFRFCSLFLGTNTKPKLLPRFLISYVETR